jgi:hypothetical protein
MNSTLKMIALSMIAIAPYGAGAQTHPAAEVTATITTENCVTLDATQPLQNFYSIDIAHLGFASEYEAKKHFGHIMNNLVSYHVDFANTKVVLEVHIDRVSSSTDVAWWNEYLSSLCK